jgi:RNA recognition motif-containing protein
LIFFFFFISLPFIEQNLFAEHGDITVAKVVKDKVTKKSLGFGFVKFVRDDDANTAIEAKNGFLMGPKKLKVSLARPPSSEIKNCKLYVTNLNMDFSERDVVDLFSQVSFFCV